jgi:hypothetical protein
MSGVKISPLGMRCEEQKISSDSVGPICLKRRSKAVDTSVSGPGCEDIPYWFVVSLAIFVYFSSYITPNEVGYSHKSLLILY